MLTLRNGDFFKGNFSKNQLNGLGEFRNKEIHITG
jgi:hypothetical protein